MKTGQDGQGGLGPNNRPHSLMVATLVEENNDNNGALDKHCTVGIGHSQTVWSGFGCKCTDQMLVHQVATLIIPIQFASNIIIHEHGKWSVQTSLNRNHSANITDHYDS